MPNRISGRTGRGEVAKVLSPAKPAVSGTVPFIGMEGIGAEMGPEENI